jgi:hypothetical protein
VCEVAFNCVCMLFYFLLIHASQYTCQLACSVYCPCTLQHADQVTLLGLLLESINPCTFFCMNLLIEALFQSSLKIATTLIAEQGSKLR